MKLTFLGADHEVTGSCTLIEACGKRFLVDAGMEQGADIYENAPLPLLAGDVDGIFLTHAHIDHAGRIPFLYKQGFRGPIYCTESTRKLCSIMLRDSAHIQEFEAEWKNRKNARSGAPLVEPLYTIQDALSVMEQFSGCSYDTIITPAPGFQIRFIDVGHLLGSASIEITVTEEGETTRIVFSGDIGNTHQPLLRDPTPLQGADVVVMESTYGDRLHGERPDYVGELTKIIQTTFDRGGNVVVPCFAVGRTQEMLYFLRQIKEEGRIKGHKDFEVYLDSPLAAEATQIFMECSDQCYDEEAAALLDAGINPITFPGLRLTATSEESKLINGDTRPKVILSASGMCEAGRIRHHLKHNLWRPECTILFVGYQAHGTLGRALVEGTTRVKLFGESIEVRAQIRQLTGMSGHADQKGLDQWLTSAPEKPRFVFVNHGDDQVCDQYTARLQAMGYQAEAPYNGSEYQVTAQGVECLVKGNTTRIQKKPAAQGQEYRDTPAYLRLVEMGKRLMAVITHNRGGANKDLAKFADQIASLCDKWER